MARLSSSLFASHSPRQMLEGSSSAVVLAEISGSILYATEKVRQWFGYAPSEITGHSIMKLLPDMCDLFAQGAPHRAAPEKVSRSVDAVADDSEPRMFRRVRCKDGREVFADVTVVTVVEATEPLLLASLGAPNPDGESEGFQSERLDAILKTASGLAHESRNALQRAVASLDLLELDLKNDSRQMELTRKIRQSLADLLDNYDEVRRFAEPINLNRAPQRLVPLAVEAFTAAMDEYEAKRPGTGNRENKTFRLKVVPGAEQNDSLCIDRQKMYCVFYHLFKNAMLSSEVPTPITLECAIGRPQDFPLPLGENEDHRPICFRISDQGHGFSEQALAKGLEPFFTTRQSGTGLGLSICRRIVDAHGGTLSIRNGDSGGAVVECLLPQNGK